MSLRSVRWFLGMAVGSAIGSAVSLTLAFWANCASAQITPDRTLPNNSNVTVNGSIFNIAGGTTAGRNLFHSFQQFSVPTGGTASFNNGLDIQNIISRVTGTSSSIIDGIIKASGTANLFFLNPNGIVFGKNASLNIGGSFVATTANAIQFGNLGTFSASEPNNPALLTINPSALFYNQMAAASIQNNSQASVNGLVRGLQVLDGKSLLLVGGDINMDRGSLTANGGRVELAGLAAPGTVGLDVAGNTLSLGVPNSTPRSDVSLSNQASVNVYGAGGGDIAINTSNLKMSNSYLFAGIGIGLGNSITKAGNVFVKDGGLIRSTTYGKGDAGNISIAASDEISLDGAGYIQDEVQGNTAQHNAGSIDINTGSLSLTHGAQIDSLTNGLGNAGNVTITATDAVTFDGVDSNQNSSGLFTQVLTNGVGKGGNINIQAGDVFVTNNGEITSDTRGRGNSGDITIKTKTLTTRNSEISSTTLGNGDAGNLTIIASDFVDLSGDSYNPLTPASGSPGGLLAQVDRLGHGQGGNLYIVTGRLSISDGSKVQVATLGDGNAGNLFIHADEIDVFNTGKPYFFPTSISGGVLIDKRVQEGIIPDIRNGKPPTGNGGSMTIETRLLNVTNGGQITSSSVAQGKAGNINIIADIARLNNGQIIGQTASSDGGNINFNLSQYLLLRNNSLISATAGTAQKGGNGGNITINTPLLIAVPNENSDITANAFTGYGGNVRINTQGIFGIQARQQLTPQSDITASSQFGVTGQITINQPDVQPTQGLIQLPNQVVDASNQIGQVCPKGVAALRRLSEFIITGRGSLPPSPLEPLASISYLPPLATLDSDAVDSNSSKHTSTQQSNFSAPVLPTQIIEATGWVKTADGSIELVAQVPQTTPYASTTGWESSEGRNKFYSHCM